MKKSKDSLASILEKARGIREAAPGIMPEACRRFRWQLAECWLPDGKQRHLSLTFSWHAGDKRLEEFETTSRGMLFEKGGGLCGFAWKNGRPVWLEDLAAPPNLARSSLMAIAGLTTGVGMPVFDGNRLVAVFCFFSRTRRGRDETILEFLSSLAADIARSDGAATPPSPTSSSHARAARA